MTLNKDTPSLNTAEIIENMETLSVILDELRAAALKGYRSESPYLVAQSRLARKLLKLALPKSKDDR